MQGRKNGATKTVLITGATSGLGLELARCYAQDARLILVGRKPLTELSDPLFTSQNYCRCDLSSPECGEVVASFLDGAGITQLDLLIHNAGVGYYGEVASQTAESVDELLNVNTVAPVRLTHALLPYLKRVRGKVVFVSSVAADVPAPDYAVYAATKAALNGFARSLGLEQRGTLQVQTLIPGAIRTDMHAKSGVPADTFDTSRFSSAAEVAAQLYQAIEHKHGDRAVGARTKLLRLAGRYLTDALDSVMRARR